MTRYVRTNYVPDSSKDILTEGKFYKARNQGDYPQIRDNTGTLRLICLNGCAFLDWKSWEVVEINEEEEKKMEEKDLKVGDRVRVVKNENCIFGWASLMDSLVGKVHKIVSVRGKLYFLDTPPNLPTYYFDRESLELIEEVRQGCSHADLMLEYAKDCQKYEKPWMKWQYYCSVTSKWIDFTEDYGHLMWFPGSQYRRKPSPININGFEVPEPLREIPNLGKPGIYETVYCPSLCENFFIALGVGNTYTKEYLKLGLCHSTKEAAILHAKALLSFTEVPQCQHLTSYLPA